MSFVRPGKIPGISPEAERVLTEAFAALSAELAELRRPPAVTGLKNDGHFATEGSVVRLRGGQRVALPRARTENAGARIVVIVEVAGAISITAHRGFVNGARVQTLSDVGAYEFFSNGVDGWYMQGSLPGTSSGAAALDAEYVLGVAHASLPNGIEPTADRQVPVAGSGTAAWQFPIEAQLDDVDQGDAHTINREDGRLSVSAGIATFEKPQSVSDAPSGTQNSYALPATLKHADILSWNLSGGAVTLNGINSTGVPDGFEFTLTQSNGGLPDGNQLTIVDESGSAGAAGYRIGTPDNISLIVGTAGSLRFKRLGDPTTGRWFVVERGFPRASTSLVYGGTSGRELQRAAISGDITIAQNSNTAAITAGAIVNADVNASAAIAQTKLGAMTGFAEKASGASATTSAEPIVTYSASANMSAERVTTSSTSITVSTSVASQIEFQRAALTGAVSAAANANGTLFAGIRDNGTLETARGFINALSTSTITALITQDAANDEQEWTWSVNLAASYTWTGGHTWNTSGDFDVTAALVSLLSSSTLSLDSVGDMTLQSDADLILTGDEVRVRSNGTGGFLTFDGATASTPGLAAGEGMYWVEDPGAAATIPRFTDDANVDWKLLAFGQPGDSALPSVGFTGTPFVVYRDVAASGSAAARDTALFNGNVPFALNVIQCGVRVNPGVGGSTMTFRDTVGGGGNALSSALSTATTGTVQFSANYTGVVQVAAGGSITCRWSDGTTGGRVWALCVRD